MSSTIKRVIAIVVVLLIITSIVIYKVNDSKIYYNESPVNGNSIGNLYGDGLFCEANGEVYFANPNDDFSLYKMNVDESNVTKICDDRVFFINADSHYIYYSRNNNNDESQMSFLNVNTNSLCRINTNGKKITILDDAVCSTLSLSKNTLLYHHYDRDDATTLYSIGIDGKNKNQLFKSAVDPRCVSGENLYFSGVENDHYLYKRDVNEGTNSTILNEWTWWPTVVGNKIYYSDLKNGDKIYCFDVSDNTTTQISNYGTTGYNASENYIFYQSLRADTDGLYMIDLRTNEETLIMSGQFNSINVTSKYVYFIDFFSGACFHAPLGGNNANMFSPAVELKKK